MSHACAARLASHCCVYWGSLQGSHSPWVCRGRPREAFLKNRFPLASCHSTEDFSVSISTSVYAHTCACVYYYHLCVCQTHSHDSEWSGFIWIPFCILRTSCTCNKIAQNYTYIHRHKWVHRTLVKSESTPWTVPMLISSFWYCTTVMCNVTIGGNRMKGMGDFPIFCHNLWF